MKKILRNTGNILLMILLYIIYTLCRQMYVFVGWRGHPNFKYWMEDSENARKQVRYLFMIAANIVVFMYIGWLAELIYLIIQVVLGFSIMYFIKKRNKAI